MNEDLERKIRDRAHQLWEAEGHPEGRADEHWQEARRQVMADEGLGEPATEGHRSAQADDDMPEPQPEIPVDPLRNPEEADPSRDAIYPTGPGPEMPGDTDPAPEIPYESGISELPTPGPADAGGGAPAAAAEGTRKRGRAAAVSGKAAAKGAASNGAAKPRSGRSGRAKPGEVTT